MIPTPVSSLPLLERLISFPTVSSRSNADLIGFVQQFLAERGIAALIVPYGEGGKANLFATLGPTGSGGILLSGHTDVVPVEGQAWTSDPFRLRQEGGRVSGRGVADMKGFLASALAAADRASRRRLRQPLHLAFSCDEEVGCLGVRSLIEALTSMPVHPDLAIIGEPTSMTVGTGHKGKAALRVRCCGRAAHSALAPSGLNAIHLATDFINRVRARQAGLIAEGAQDPAYDVPYTTLHVGRIHGGTALNIVPDACEIEMEFRHLAEDRPDVLISGLEADAEAVARPWREQFPEASVTVDVTNAYPGLGMAADDPAVTLLAGLASTNTRVKLAFGTEGGLFRERLNIPALVCGPGSMDQGHKPDEWLALDQLAACDRMMDAVIDRLAE